MISLPVQPHNNYFTNFTNGNINAQYSPQEVYAAQQASIADQELFAQLQQQQAHYEQYLHAMQQISQAMAQQAYHQPLASTPLTGGTLTPAPAPAAPYTGPVCRQWATDGRCSCKRCPLAASHTAENSPRYRHRPQQVSPGAPVPTAPTSRPNALLIVDPSEQEPKQEVPAAPKKEAKEEAEATVKAVAEPVKAKAKGKPSKKAKGKKKGGDPFTVPKPRPEALKITEATRASGDRTPSPPGSRLGLWMKNMAAQD